MLYARDLVLLCTAVEAFNGRVLLGAALWAGATDVAIDFNGFGDVHMGRLGPQVLRHHVECDDIHRLHDLVLLWLDRWLRELAALHRRAGL